MSPDDAGPLPPNQAELFKSRFGSPESERYRKAVEEYLANFNLDCDSFASRLIELDRLRADSLALREALKEVALALDLSLRDLAELNSVAFDDRERALGRARAVLDRLPNG